MCRIVCTKVCRVRKSLLWVAAPSSRMCGSQHVVEKGFEVWHCGLSLAFRLKLEDG